MSIFVVLNSNTGEIMYVSDYLDRIKQFIKDDKKCGIYYPYLIKRYSLDTGKEIPVDTIDECGNCDVYERYKNGIHARCPKDGIWDYCYKKEFNYD